MSDDGYPYYYFSGGYYEVDENDRIDDEFGNKFVRFNEDLQKYFGRLDEYKKMLEIMVVRWSGHTKQQTRRVEDEAHL